MFYNNLKIALRSLWKNKLYSSINILGLGFGIACFLFISLYALDELTFDRMHHKFDQIYRLTQKIESDEKGIQRFGVVSVNAGLAARTELAGVENSVRMAMWGRAVLRNEENQQAFYQNFLTVENSFLDIFDFVLLEGDRQSALSEPNSIVLTESFAHKLFKGEDPMGKTLHSDRGLDLKVTGILHDFPVNSHLQFESIISFSTLEVLPWWEEQVANDWSSQEFGTYLLLGEGADPQSIGQQLTAFAEVRSGEERPFAGEIILQPLRDVHFGSENIQRELNENKSTYRYLTIFSLIGIFILAIACINYVNLSTARSVNYRQEVGVRKVIGAGRRQLFARFMSESILLTFVALLVALALVQAGLPWLNNFSGKELSLSRLSQGVTLPLLILAALMISFIAGSYPAIYLSRFKPAAVLKDQMQHNRSTGQDFLRKSLVVVQFALSVLMIVGTLVVWKQMQYVRSQDLGFQKDHMIVVDINSGKVRNGFETIMHGYEQLPNVQSVTVSSRVPGEWKTLLQAQMRPQGKFEEPGVRPWYLGADEHFLETFDIELVAGRNFNPAIASDSTALILNQQAAKALGIEDPSGQEVLVVSSIANGSERMLNHPYRANVIGIMEDINFQSLYEPIAPFALAYRTNPIQSIDYFTARVSPRDLDRTIAQMTDILHSVDPEQIFEYHFLDSQIETFYEADTRRSRLFSLAALCAMFIACLGLFGLATYMAERRTKEIGIRKVLGASVIGIVGLLSKDFIRLVLIAIVIATPIAWYAMNRWLQGFAYRIELQWWMFAGAGLVAVVIAITTVAGQSVRAAMADPVNSLRSE